MKKTFLYLSSSFLTVTMCLSKAYTQVAINTDGSLPHSSAMLDVKSTNKGFLAPRLTTALRTAIPSPATGLLVYDTDTNSYWYFNGTAWTNLAGSGVANAWLLTGNAGTNPASNFIGTTDNQPIRFRLNNNWAGEWNATASNYGIGLRTLRSVTTGVQNVAMGTDALSQAITGSSNTAIGFEALQFNLSSYNSAFGHQSMKKNTLGLSNSSFGAQALYNNTIGDYNNALGLNALYSNTVGYDNTAIGQAALYTNTTGFRNVAVGNYALLHSTTSNQVAVGFRALNQSTTGLANNALGSEALFNNSSGSRNNAFGTNALRNNTSGWYNSAFGTAALDLNTGSENTAIGDWALGRNTTGSNNTALGSSAGVNLPSNVSNVTVIGYGTGWGTTASNQVNIGNFSVSWIGGQVPWSIYSDERIKRDITENVPGLAFITKLKPVMYYLDIRKQTALANARADGPSKHAGEENLRAEQDWEGKYDVEKIAMSGFLAQDVEKAAIASNYSFSGVTKPKDGKGLYSLQYSSFVVPLVKAVQEQQQQIETMKKENAELRSLLLEMQKEMRSMKVEK